MYICRATRTALPRLARAAAPVRSTLLVKSRSLAPASHAVDGIAGSPRWYSSSRSALAESTSSIAPEAAPTPAEEEVKAEHAPIDPLAAPSSPSAEAEASTTDEPSPPSLPSTESAASSPPTDAASPAAPAPKPERKGRRGDGGRPRIAPNQRVFVGGLDRNTDDQWLVQSVAEVLRLPEGEVTGWCGRAKGGECKGYGWVHLPSIEQAQQLVDLAPKLKLDRELNWRFALSIDKDPPNAEELGSARRNPSLRRKGESPSFAPREEKVDGESSTVEGAAVTPSPAKPARKTPKSKVKEEPKEESTTPGEPPRRVFVGGLEAENVDEAWLAEALDKVMGPGLISGLMMATKQRKRLPYAFVEFNKSEDAQRLVELAPEVEGAPQVTFSLATSRSSRALPPSPSALTPLLDLTKKGAEGEPTMANVFVGALEADMSPELLRERVVVALGLQEGEAQEEIVGVRMPKNDDGSIKGFGFIEFRNADLATRLLRLEPALISPSPDTYTSLHNPTLRPTRPPRSTNTLRTTHPPSNTIQINNLHPDTTQQELYDTFDPFGTVWKCKMIRWQAAKGQEQRLSAYLGVRSVEAAELAIWKATSKEGIVLRGKRVHVQFAAPPKLKAKPAVGGEVEGEGGKAGGTKRGQGSAARAEQQRRDARWQEQQRKRRSEQRPRRVKEAEAEAESAAGSTSAGDPGLANLFRNW